MVTNRTLLSNIESTPRLRLINMATPVIAAIWAALALLLALHLVSGQTALAAGSTRYVAPGGNCGGMSPCYATIQSAVDAAAANDEILVASGVYTGVTTRASRIQLVYIDQTLTLRGGYTTTNWFASNPAAYPTILDAESGGRVMYLTGAVSPTIEGLVLRGGKAPTGESGGGIYIDDGSPLVRANTIYSNTASVGGGIYNNGGSPRLQRNNVYSNTATNFGGGLFNNSGAPVLQNNLFHHNQAANFGGGVANQTSSAITIWNDTYYQNTAANGGGLVNFGVLTVTNSLIISNTAATGGGVYNSGSAASDYNDIWGNSTSSNITAGTHDISQDPLWQNPTGNDFRLTSTSPARDAGLIVAAVTDDFAGNGRPFDSSHDMGAYEYTTSSDCYARVQNGPVYTAVQPAINAASAGSLVQVAGRCEGVSASGGLNQTGYISQNLTLRGGYTVTDWVTPQYGAAILNALGGGRALYITGTTAVVIENLRLTGGSYTGNGGGVYIGRSSNTTLQNTVIDHNAATGNGGGVYNSGSGSVTLQHNTIYSNTASFGGGVYAATGGGQVTLNNTAVISNLATTGGGGGGIYDPASGSGFSLAYNNFFGNSPNAYGGLTAPATDIARAPGFANAASGDFHLALSSGLINAASPATALSTDFDNQPRPQGSRADIGADESLVYAEAQLSSAPESPQVVLDTATVVGKLITFTHTLTNAGQLSGSSDTFNLSYTNTDGWPVTLAGVGSAVTLAQNGSVTFKVVVAVPITVTEPLFNQTIITATSQTNNYIQATATDVIAKPGLELSPSYTQNADPGEVLTYTHTLKNTGPITDVFTVNINSPLGWGIQLVPTAGLTVALGPGETTPIVIRVVVTDTAPAGLGDVMTVTATSVGFGISGSVTNTTIANATTGPRFVSQLGGSDVDNNCTRESSPCATISHAVQQAANGDPVRVAQGTYTDYAINISLDTDLLGGYIFDIGSGTFNLPGVLDPALTVIDAGNNGRGLNILVAPAFKPEIRGFTIKNAATTGVGGGILVQANSAPNLSKLIIQNSSATQGGGIYIDRGSPDLQDITIAGASAAGQGGGIYINNGSPSLKNVVISTTTAADGGGLYLAQGSPVISGSSISSASATRGGGIYQNNGNLTGQRLTIQDNIASGNGGGIYLAGGTQIISQTRIGGNTGSQGGGIYSGSGGQLTLWNNLVYSNTASATSGGGLYNSGALQLVNNTLYANRATSTGGGIFDNNTAGLVISNTVVVSNTAVTAGGGLYRSGSGSTAARIDYNDIWGNQAAASANSNVSAGAHSIAANPLFISETAADINFLHVGLGSPIVDTAQPGTFLTVDIDDQLRPVGQGFDMGADEVSGCLATIQRTGQTFGVVQNAVDAAQGGDVVQIAGLCRGVQARQLDGQTIRQTVFIDKGITLAGLDNPELNPPGQKATLDALNLGRVVVLTGSLPVNITNLQLTGGNAAAGGSDSGGGIYSYDNILQVENSVITGNQATYGGGIFNYAGALTLGGATEAKRTQVMSNTATYGGGIYLSGGSPELGYVTIAQNRAQTGGGIYNDGGQPTLTQIQLFTNTVTANGGGLYNTGGLLAATEITAAFNSAVTGGGFYNEAGSQLSLQRSIILSNTAGDGGGGANPATGVLTMVNTILAENTASGNGGGLNNQSEQLTLRHDTFYANTASGNGGGIYHSAGTSTPLVNSSIVVNNTASGGGGIYSAGANPTFDYNVVAGNSSNNYGGGSLNAGSGSGNLPEATTITFLSTDAASPKFLHIPTGSPAEDAAQPRPDNPVDVDIDQDPRPFNRGFDIGADEVGNCYARINGAAPTYGNVQLAIERSSAGDTIFIAGDCQGVNTFVDNGQTISQTVLLTKSLTLQGGYTKDNWTTADPAGNPTTLNALDLGRVAYITNSAQIQINGLQLLQGSADNGGGVFVGSGVLTMTNSQVYSNNAVLGGAFYAQPGGEINLRGDNQLSGDNLVYNNTATSGGAFYNNGGRITLDDNSLYNNTATSGGAFFHAAGTSLLQNNIIRGNRAASGGALYNNAAGLTVWHNTFYQNNVSTGNGAGLYNQQGTPDVRNNIFTGDIGNSIIYSSPVYTFTYNNVFPHSGSVRTGGSVTTGVGFITADPNLTADFHLNTDSPVIDQGDPAMPLTYDFDGPSASPAGPHLRPSDQGFDMGADEQPSCLSKIVRTGIIYGSLQQAVNFSQPNDTILVTADECRGVHPFNIGSQVVSQTVHITHSLTLLGGYKDDFSAQTGLTTLNPLGLGRAMLVTNTETLMLSYFMLQNGNAAGLGGSSSGDAGGGMYNNAGSSLLSNVKVYSNTAGVGGGIFFSGGVITMTADNVYSNTAATAGGGIYNDTGAINLQSNTIYQNATGGSGGGMYNHTGVITFTANSLYGNSALYGGGFYNYNSNSVLDGGNRFYNNQAAVSNGSGGAIYTANGNPVIQNTFIYSNSAYYRGGAIFIGGGSPQIIHNTFYQNAGTQPTSQGGAIFSGGGSATIKNNIFDQNSVNNANNGTAIFATGSSPVLEPNDYSPGNVSSQVKGISVTAGNNLNINPPDFADPDNADLAKRDFHLQSTSGLIDNALAANLGLDHDFENDPRPSNRYVEMGADEYNTCLVRVVATGNTYGRIQPALDEAPTGTTVKIAEGTCYEAITINKPVTLSGSWDKSFSSQSTTVIKSTIDAVWANSRVITVTEIDGEVTIDWLEITHGNAGTQDGGGVWSRAGTLNLIDTDIANNTARNGGGVAIIKGTLANGNTSVVEYNHATANGGGLYIADGITRTVDIGFIDSNDASGDGGGVYIGQNSVAMLTGSADGNTALGNGGGIYNAPGSITLEEGSRGQGSLSENTANGYGGGAYVNNANFESYEDIIGWNEAATGGGLYVTGSSHVTLTNNSIYSNTATSGSGGGIYRNATGTTELYHATIHYNSANTTGGGIYNSGGPMVISASILAFNQAATGNSGVTGGGNLTIADSLLEPGNSYGGYVPQDTIINADPVFRSGYVANGILMYSSPAIDQVSNSKSAIDVDYDLQPRPALCQKDMGRDEFSVTGSTVWLPAPDSIAANPEPSELTLAPTQTGVYTFYLQNQSQNYFGTGDTIATLGIGSGYTETISLTINSSKGWAQGFVANSAYGIADGDQEAVFALGPGDIAVIQVKVDVPAGAPASISGNSATTELTTLTYQARQCPGGSFTTADSSAATTRVVQNYSFEIAPDNFGGPVLPGQTITYSHILTNTGNITDDYSITPGASLYAIGDVAEPSTYLVQGLAPGVSTTIVVSVTIRDEAAGGLTDVTGFTAQSSLGAKKGVADNTVISYTTGTRYVSSEGNDSLVDETVGSSDPNAINYKDNNCTQPNIGACRTIQQALDQAAADDLIKIEQGLYNVIAVDVLSTTYNSQTITQTAFVDKPVTLQGGYIRTAWDENPPNHISHTTIIDPQSLGRGIFVTANISPTAVVTIDRLTIRNGSAGSEFGGAIYNEGTANLVLNANRLHASSAAQGGGLYNTGGNLLLQNNMLHDNTATSGGAVYINAGAATLQNNTFNNNQASGSGGAIYAANGSLVITNTIFANSTGNAVAIAGAVSPALAYNLYYNNTANDFVQNGIPATPPGSNNRFANPLFINPAANPSDLHLQSGSPARDTGDPATSLTIDYDNDPRPLPPTIGGFDRGADERMPVQGLLFYSDTVTSTLAGNLMVITHILENTGDITDTFTITAGSSQPWPINFDHTLPYTITLASGISRTVIVTYTAPLTAAGQTNVTLITATSTLTSQLATVRDEIKVKAAEWQISKTVMPAGPVQPGDTLTYTLTITNTGDLTATLTYTITDELPEHTAFASASPSAQTTAPASWVLSNPVGVGQSISVTLVVTVARPLTTGVAIINQTYGITGGGAPAAATGEAVSVLVDAPASLTATKTAAINLVRPGDALTYTITITNLATAFGPALNVVVTDTLPTAGAPVSWGFTPPATGTITLIGRTLTWQLANAIQPDGVVQLTATVRITSPLAVPASLTNTFGVTASNIATVITGTVTTPITAANTITLAKTVNPTTTISGGVLTYTITLTNSGDSIAAVIITDVLDSAFNAASTVINVVVPGRAWGADAGAATVTFTATAPITPGQYYNAAITATYDLTTTTLTHTAPVTVEVPPAELTLQKTPAEQFAFSGDTVTFTISVTNTGLARLAPITITDEIAPACSQVITAGLDIAAGATYQCALANVTASLTNTAVVTGWPVSGFGSAVTATASARVTLVTPTIAIAKAAITPLVRNGGVATFTITVTNTGNVTLTNVAVTDPPACGQSVGTLPPGGHTSYTCPQSGVTASFTNTAIASGDYATGKTVTNSAEAWVQVVTPALTISKLPASQIAAVNTPVTFTIRITNSGDITLTVNISDATTPACDHAAGSLASGGFDTYTCVHSGAAADFSNTVIATGTTALLPGEVVTASDTALVSVLTPGLAVTKTPGLQYARSGQPVTFTITITNSGYVSFTAVDIADTRAANCNKTLGALGVGQMSYYTCAVTVTADLTNTVAVTATPITGNAITGTASAVVKMIAPAIQIEKTASGALIRRDQAVTFTIRITNTGDSNLTGVTVADPLYPAECNHTVGSLTTAAPATSYTCTASNVTAPLTNTATVTGVALDGGVVTATAATFVNVITPSLQIEKTTSTPVIQPGETATFTISITNTGDTALSVNVTDTRAPNCDRSGLSLAVAGGGVYTNTYTCALANVTADFTNTVAATGTTALLPGENVTGSAAAYVNVIAPAITVAKTPDLQYARSGQAVTFTIIITNSGDSLTLDPITVTDALAPACSRVLTNTFLFAGISTQFDCSATITTTDMLNTVVVAGVSPEGSVVTHTDTAFVDMVTPAIAITKLPATQNVPNGGTATFTITITNTGDITLTDVVITDLQAPACDRSPGVLPPLTGTSYTCAVTNVTASFINTAIVTGTPFSLSGVITATASAAVNHVSSALQLTKLPAVQYIQPGGTATFTIGVTNTGSITLTSVVISDALTANCEHTFTSLAPNGGFDSITCAKTGVTGSFTNTAIATGTTSLGGQVTASAQAFVDAVLPATPTLLSPPNQSYTNTTSVTFGWLASSNAATYTLLVSGTAINVAAPTTATTSSLPGDGVYTWTVRAADTHGRVSGYATAWQVTVDTTPPTAPVLQLPTNGQVISNTARPGFFWSASTDALSGPVTYTVIITSSGSLITTTTTAAFTPTTSLSTGLYTWTVLARDRAGNISASPQVFTFTRQSQSSIVYLPIILKNYTTQPDLVPTRLIVQPSTGLGPTTPVMLGVVIANQGTATAPANFWVDLYINPNQLPTEAGHLWSSSGYCGTPCYGLAWQIKESLAPGQVITVTSTGQYSQYLQTDYTIWPGYFNRSGTNQVGAYVDSWNGANTSGFVLESNEANNAIGLTGVGVTGSSIEAASSAKPERVILPRPLPVH